jgi:hypothetical protein
VGAGFSTDTFFKDVANYEATLAKKAQAAGVSVIGIGVGQYGLDTDAYKNQWQTVVDTVRKNYSGKLAYSSGEYSTPIWSIVDIVSTIGWDKVDGALDRLNSLADTYGKPVYIDSVTAGGGEGQAARIRDILKASIIDRKQDLAGISFHEFAPWQQADRFVNPQKEKDKQWLESHGYTNDLYNKNAENALIQLAQKIDAHYEVERNKLEQENRNKPNPEYLRVMGLVL